MEITEKTIRDLAEFNRLEFSDEEVKKYVEDFKSMVKMFEQMDEVENIENLKRTNLKINAETDLREDTERQGITVQDVVKNSPESCGGAVVVPAVVE